MPHSNNKQFPTITFYSSHLHHLTTTSNSGRWHDDEAVSKDGAPSAHSAPKSLFAGLEVHKIAHHGYDDPEQNISRLLKHQFSLALLSSVSNQELATSISTDLRVLSQQRSSKAPHPTNTLQQFAQWKATLLHKNLAVVRNTAVPIFLRRSAPTATRRRSSRFLANLAGQVHFLVYGLGSTNTRMSNTVHRFFSSASSILRSLTVVNLWPSCVNQIFHEACHIYIIVCSNIAAHRWYFRIKHFASLLDFELFCCTGAASYYNSAIGLSNTPFLFFAAWALCQCLLHALCVALRSSSLYMYFFKYRILLI